MKIRDTTIRLIVWAMVTFLVLIGSLLLLASTAPAADLGEDRPTLVSSLAYLKDFPEVHDYKVTSERDAYIAFRHLPKDWELLLESAAFIANANLGHLVNIHFVTVKGLSDAPDGYVICTVTASKRRIERKNCI